MIRRRLTAMMLLTSAAGIALACSALIGYEFIQSRREGLAQVATLARIVAANSTAALAFQDERVAAEVLGTLRTEPNIMAAALYDQQGRLFARYVAPGRSGELFPQTPARDGFTFSLGELEGFQPVSERPEHRLGTLYIRADRSVVFQRFWLYGIISLSAIAASLLLAYVLSRFFQARISRPILSLADTARAVSERADFSVRAPVVSEHDEFRLLTSAFNTMLERIEKQNTELNENLEERSAAERKLQKQLARLDLLQRTTRAIGERQDLSSIFQVILRSLEDNLPVDFACVCLHDAAARKLVVSSVGPKSSKLAEALGMLPSAEVPIEQNGLSRCVRGTLVYEPDTTEIDFPVPQRFASARLHALVAAPLLVETQVFGVLLAARYESNSFSSGECEFLRQLSEHAALAAHQIELYTRLQQAYDDLQETQKSILQQERLRALGQMASGIAHDINNAISPVALYAESLLEREPNLSEQARNYLRIIQRSIEDVGQTVTRLREFYRQREQRSELVPVDLNPLIGQVLALTRARWSDVPQERGVVIDVRRDLDASLPKVLGTESDIRDALTNLIFNAVDAMPEGGTLTLRTRKVPAEGGGPSEQVDLEVIDTGTGMDEETRRRCLEPFFTTKGERGTGMGLAMVYGMVQRQGAQIEIDSELGKGTTVRLRFEVAAPATATQAELPAMRPTRALKLLVIDDDPLVTQSLYEVLRNEGHEVTTADGGQQGIDTFSAAHRAGESFDVVMTDLGMPYVDGRAVANAIKALAPDMPIILLTGWGQRLATEQNIPANVDKLLSKPPKLQELRHALAQLTSSEAAERAT